MIDASLASLLALVAVIAGMQWLLLRDVWIKATRCMFRGHLIREAVLAGIGVDGRGEIETKCGRCGFKLLLYVDPDDDDYYLVEDYW